MLTVMTLREEILKEFEDAKDRIEQRAPRPGILPRADAPDLRFVSINETNEAIANSLLKIADRIDALEKHQLEK